VSDPAVRAARAVQLRGRGWSLRRIGNLLGVSHEQVRKDLTRAGQVSTEPEGLDQEGLKHAPAAPAGPPAAPLAPVDAHQEPPPPPPAADGNLPPLPPAPPAPPAPKQAPAAPTCELCGGPHPTPRPTWNARSVLARPEDSLAVRRDQFGPDGWGRKR
jgi:hypothetical protein